VALALDMYPGAIFATELCAKQLAGARELARRHGVQDKITFLEGDGLGVIDGDIDAVTICGLGGETIARILSGSGKLGGHGITYILQPQSRVGRLCAWLDENGFSIADAALARERGRIYPIFSVRGSGGGRSRMRVFEILAQARDPLLPEYVGALHAAASTAALGQASSKSIGLCPEPAAEELRFLGEIKDIF
jgi:tRNA (adenine22-N1)-methyltransferase